MGIYRDILYVSVLVPVPAENDLSSDLSLNIGQKDGFIWIIHVGTVVGIVIVVPLFGTGHVCYRVANLVIFHVQNKPSIDYELAVALACIIDILWAYSFNGDFHTITFGRVCGLQLISGVRVNKLTAVSPINYTVSNILTVGLLPTGVQNG